MDESIRLKMPVSKPFKISLEERPAHKLDPILMPATIPTGFEHHWPNGLKLGELYAGFGVDSQTPTGKETKEV